MSSEAISDIMYETKGILKGLGSLIEKDLDVAFVTFFKLFEQGYFIRPFIFLMLSPFVFLYDLLTYILPNLSSLLGKISYKVKIIRMTREISKKVKEIEMYAESKGKPVNDMEAFEEIHRFVSYKVIGKNKISKKEVDDLLIKASFAKEMKVTEDLEIDTDLGTSESNLVAIEGIRKQLLRDKFSLFGEVLKEIDGKWAVSFGEITNENLSKICDTGKLFSSDDGTFFLLDEEGIEKIKKELISLFMFNNIKMIIG